MPIGQITQITDIQSQKVTDEHKNKDIKYKEKLTFKILNGEFKGQTTTIPHQYVKSQADSESFSKMTRFFYIFLKILKTQLL